MVGAMAAVLLGAAGAQAQTALFTYQFSDVTTTPSSGTSSAGGSATGVNFSSFTAVGTPANPNAAGRFSFTNWPIGATNGSDTFTGGISLTEYYQFTITAPAGY